MFERVLVANRGEIALRVIRTLHRMGIEAVAVAVRADLDAPHARAADLVVRLEDGGYLSVADVVGAATRTGAAALHPGYGFLSESPVLARACAEAGVVFIGPPATAIATMGDKIAAKRTVSAAGVPVVPGVHEPGMADDDLVAASDEVGFPLMVKAAAGGGGKGMRVVEDVSGLRDAIAAARREARAAFDDDTLLIERVVRAPRHIEVQVLADTHDTVWGFTERECSLQRRHQKVIEESPSPVLHPAARTRLVAAAVDAARACGYVGAGTVEMLVPGATADRADTEAFFLEMNTRLQVEHPVTEQIHGLDLVEWQVRIAAGASLPPHPPPAFGHAVEARVYAEDPANGFLPTGGTIVAYADPGSAGAPVVRVDSGVGEGVVVGSAFDPLLAKVVVRGDDRATALRRLRRALGGMVTLGVRSNVPLLRALLAHESVVAGRLDTGLIERELDALLAGQVPTEEVVAVAARLVLPAAGWRMGTPAESVHALRVAGASHEVVVTSRCVAVDGREPHEVSIVRDDGRRVTVAVDDVVRTWVHARVDDGVLLGCEGDQWHVVVTDDPTAWGDGAVTAGDGPLLAPMPGSVTVVDVEVGDEVTAGQRLVVIEAMKMEHPVVATADGVVVDLRVAAGDRVGLQDPLVVVRPHG